MTTLKELQDEHRRKLSEITADHVHAQQEQDEELRQASVARGARIDADAAKGIIRDEPRPDPAANAAIALTSSPGLMWVTGDQPAAEAPTPPARTGTRRATVDD